MVPNLTIESGLAHQQRRKRNGAPSVFAFDIGGSGPPSMPDPCDFIPSYLLVAEEQTTLSNPFMVEHYSPRRGQQNREQHGQRDEHSIPTLALNKPYIKDQNGKGGQRDHNHLDQEPHSRCNTKSKSRAIFFGLVHVS